MKIIKFEDIVVWQKGKDFAVKIYKKFNDIKDYSFRDQIQRASMSISNNIAEGFERQSNKELSRFLYISKGSCAEVRSMLYVALELKYLTGGEVDNLVIETEEISRMLQGFIRTL